MTEPIRILHVLGTVNRGGAESRIMDLYRQMDRELIQFDFLVHTDREGHFEQEITDMGGHVYRVPRFRGSNIRAYRKAIREFFRDHLEFRYVQGHMTSTAAIYLPIAKASGVPVTIAHARNAGVEKGVKGIATRLLRHNLAKKADYLFACSRLAGEAVFGRQAVLAGRTVYIPNAIDVGRFCFNSQARASLRKEWGLDGELVIGHVGRFDYQKNHEYLIRIFYEIHKLGRDARLVLLGEGAGMAAIKGKAAELGLAEKVYFLGNQRDIHKYYQVMDYFVFPSRYEGLPGTVIEAQAAGLRCLISDAIAEEARITDLVQMKSIEAPAAEWAALILETADYLRAGRKDELLRSDFDVKRQAAKMAEFYITGNLAGLTDT